MNDVSIEAMQNEYEKLKINIAKLIKDGVITEEMMQFDFYDEDDIDVYYRLAEGREIHKKYRVEVQIIIRDD